MTKFFDNENYTIKYRYLQNNNVSEDKILEKKIYCNHCPALFSHIENFQIHYNEMHKKKIGLFNCCDSLN